MLTQRLKQAAVVMTATARDVPAISNRDTWRMYRVWGRSIEMEKDMENGNRDGIE